MTYYLALFDGKPQPLLCKECYLRRQVENPDLVERILNVYNRHICAIYELYSSESDSEFIVDTDYQTVLDKINDIKPYCKDVHCILKDMILCRVTDATKMEIFGISKISEYISEKLLPCDQLSNISFAEIILPDMEISHHHYYGSLHVTNNYEIVQTWKFNRDFVKHLMSQNLDIISASTVLFNIAIQNRDFEMLDELIASGADININIRTSGCHRNCAIAAAETGHDVLKCVLNYGCRHVVDALVVCIRKSDREMAQIIFPFCEMEAVSLNDKICLISVLIQRRDTIEFFEDFRKAGLVITDEIINKLQPTIKNMMKRDVVEYLLSIGISVACFRNIYTSSCISSKLEILKLLEKNGFFEHYKPAEFLVYATGKKDIMEHLLNLDVDTISDHKAIRKAFINSCPKGADHAEILEPYLNTLDQELLKDAMIHLIYCGLNTQQRINGFNYLLAKGAVLSNHLVFLAAMYDAIFFECIIDLELEFDVNFNLRYEELVSIYNPSISFFLNMTRIHKYISLIEIVIFKGNYERLFIKLVQRGAKVDSQRLTTIFSEYLNPEYEHREHLKPCAKFLIENGYLDMIIQD